METGNKIPGSMTHRAKPGRGYGDRGSRATLAPLPLASTCGKTVEEKSSTGCQQSQAIPCMHAWPHMIAAFFFNFSFRRVDTTIYVQKQAEVCAGSLARWLTPHRQRSVHELRWLTANAQCAATNAKHDRSRLGSALRVTRLHTGHRRATALEDAGAV